MLKLSIKLAVVSLILLGAMMCLTTTKAAADSCPTSNPPGDNWAAGFFPNNIGENAGTLAGAVVHAYVGSYANSDGSTASNTYPSGGSYGTNTGDNLNVAFTMQSYNSEEGNNRFFLWPRGDNGRSDHDDNSTGSLFTSGAPNYNYYNCDGWTVYGPGQVVNGRDMLGNGTMLDCGSAGGYATRFWFSHISNPLGQDGYWEVETYGTNGHLSNNLNTMGSGDKQFYFTVSNGNTTRINLIWHPKMPQSHQTGSCTFLDVTLSGSYDNHNKRAHVEISGTDHDVDENIPSDDGGTGTYEKAYNYNPMHNAISVKVTVEYHDSGGWHLVPGANNPNVIRTTDQPCITATCSIYSVIGDGPGNIVQAGHNYRVLGNLSNTSPPPDLMAERNPGVFVGGSQVDTNNGVRTIYTGQEYSGETKPIDLTLKAPDKITKENLSFTPLSEFGQDGPLCYTSLSVFQEFKIDPAASIITNDSENPYEADGVTHGISYEVGGKLEFGATTTATTTGKLTKNGTKVDGDHATSDSYGTISHQYDYADSSFKAGDQYCADVTISPGHGWHGPDGDSNDMDVPGSSCMTVTNKPYFKVYGSGASAASALKDSSGSCASGTGGLLAGWNDNAGGQERGAGAQLSALALVKITGFASAQVDAVTHTGTDAAKLTFANKGVAVNTSSDSPALGGSFSPSATCIANYSPPTGGAGSTTLPGGSSYGGASGITDNRSVFVNGDVTITGPVTYGAISDLDHVPSFVLHATGNIKIDPSVTRLDGLFVSDKKIYTCGNSSGAITSFDTCNNQLLVHGGLIANQVKFGRTFGSLRDEEPAVKTKNVPNNDGSVGFHRYYCGGGYPGYHYYQVDSSPPLPTKGHDGCRDEGIYGYVLPTQTSGSVPLYYAEPVSKTGQDAYYTTNQASAAAACQAGRTCPVVVGYVQSSSKNNTTPLYGLYSKGTETHFYTTDQSEYNGVKSSLGSDLVDQGIVAYVYTSSGQGGSSKAVPDGLITTGPPFKKCSNAGVQVTIQTCAAEVIEFSPELYLSTPSINNTDSGKWDAVTGLPPVL